MKNNIMALLVSSLVANSAMAQMEMDLFEKLDVNQSGDISSSEFDAFVESVVTNKLAKNAVFCDISVNDARMRVYKEEIIKSILNGSKQFFELQDKNGDLIITKDEYNNDLMLPLLNIGE